MRKHLYCSCLILLIILPYFTAYSQYQTEGLIKVSTAAVDRNDSTLMETVSWRESTKIWFKDSCVIYELRINLESSDQTPEGIVIKKSYPVWKYIYLDLRTMACQDYYTFKDTAAPFCNYILKSNDTIGVWKFYGPKKSRDTADGMASMTDTTVNNTRFKRIRLLFQYPDEKIYGIYYLNCSGSQNMFHINRTLDEIYPGCKVIRSDFFDTTGNLMNFFEYEIINKTLSRAEKKLFNQWHRNAKKTKLPLLSYSEASRTCVAHNPEHENPTIKILPLGNN